MAAVSSLFVELKLQAENFNQGLKNAQKEAKEFQKTWAPTINLLETAGKAAVVAATAIAAAIVTATKVAADYGDAIRDASIQTGLATETLAGLKLMAEQNGSTLAEVSSGLKFLSKNFIEATEGGKAQIKAFQDLGISTQFLKDQNGQLDPVMRRVMDQLRLMPEGAKKTEVMLALMGKSAVGLTEAFSQGSRALDLYTQQTKLFGTSVTPQAAKAADDFNDSLNMLKQAMLGVSVTAGNEFIGPLTKAVEWLTAGTIAVRLFGEQIAKIGTSLVLNNFGLELAVAGVAMRTLVEITPGATTALGAFKGVLKEVSDIQAEMEFDASMKKHGLEALLAEESAKWNKQETERKATQAANRDHKLKKDKAAAAAQVKLMDDMYASILKRDAAAKGEMDANREFQIRHEQDMLEESARKQAAIYDDMLDKYKDHTSAISDISAELAAELSGQTVKQINDARQKAAEEAQAARDTSREWRVNFDRIVSDANSFKGAMLNIAKRVADGMLNAFLTGFFSPMTQKVGQLGQSLGGAVLGGIPGTPAGSGGGGGSGGVFSGSMPIIDELRRLGKLPGGGLGVGGTNIPSIPNPGGIINMSPPETDAFPQPAMALAIHIHGNIVGVRDFAQQVNSELNKLGRNNMILQPGYGR